MPCEVCERIELEITAEEDDITLEVDFEGETIDTSKIKNVKINEDGELIFTYVDGTIQNLGVVVGKDGEIATVDQTYKPDSKNAQSGVAVAKAVESKLDKNLTAYPQMDLLNENGLDINLICLFDIISKAPFTISLEKLKAVIVGDIDTALDNINKELNGLETLLASI